MSAQSTLRLVESEVDLSVPRAHSFTAYDFTRQPRKSWFVPDGTGADSTTASADASTSATPSVAVHSQALALDEQPMADMTSSRSAADLRAGSAMSSSYRLERGETATNATGSEYGQGQSYEMERRTGQSIGAPGQAS